MFFPLEMLRAFFEILLPNFKPILVGTIYRQPNQLNSLGVLNENTNKIDSVNNEIYILGDLKPDPHLLTFIESPLKMMKNAFYFILKALFILKIFKFLSRLFGHVGKTA